MARESHTEEQIGVALRQADAGTAVQGALVASRSVVSCAPELDPGTKRHTAGGHPFITVDV